MGVDEDLQAAIVVEKKCRYELRTALENTGGVTVGFGKFSESTYSTVFRVERGYVDWVTEQTETHGRFAAFQEWCDDMTTLQDSVSQNSAVVCALRRRVGSPAEIERRNLKQLRASTARGQLLQLPVELVCIIVATLSHINDYLAVRRTARALCRACQPTHQDICATFFTYGRAKQVDVCVRRLLRIPPSIVVVRDQLPRLVLLMNDNACVDLLTTRSRAVLTATRGVLQSTKNTRRATEALLEDGDDKHGVDKCVLKLKHAQAEFCATTHAMWQWSREVDVKMLGMPPAQPNKASRVRVDGWKGFAVCLIESLKHN